MNRFLLLLLLTATAACASVEDQRLDTALDAAVRGARPTCLDATATCRNRLLVEAAINTLIDEHLEHAP